MPPYVPHKGDFIALTFDPQAGHEQQGRRPALVVSNDLFNQHTGLCIVCPVTNTYRGYPFHVQVPTGEPIAGVVMAEHVKSVDYRARGAKLIAPAPAAVVDEVLSILDACLY